VKLIVTSQNQDALDLWREIVAEVGQVEFGANPADSPDLDAVVISGVWAFGRLWLNEYGGSLS
jgi:hypothetical protein